MIKEEALAKLRKQRDWQYVTLDDDAVRFTNELISMLQNATIWTPCSERMPTVEDGGRTMEVNVKYPDGSVGTVDTFWEVYGEGYDPIAWSRIETIGGGNG